MLRDNDVAAQEDPSYPTSGTHPKQVAHPLRNMQTISCHYTPKNGLSPTLQIGRCKVFFDGNLRGTLIRPLTCGRAASTRRPLVSAPVGSPAHGRHVGDLLHHTGTGRRHSDQGISHCSTAPVLTESASRFAGGVEAGNGLTGQVEDLAFAIDAQPGPCIVERRRRPGGIEGARLDPELRCRFAEVSVGTPNKAVVPRHCFGQGGWRHRNPLLRHDDLRCQFFQRVCREEESVGIDDGRPHSPIPASPGSVIKDEPDRAAAVQAVADSRQSGVDTVLRVGR